MRYVKPFLIGSLTAAIISTSGCAGLAQNEYFNQENIGTAIGVVAGVALGSQIGGGSGRTAAMLVGALAGGALGKAIGGRLDERDRQSLALQTQRMLEQDSTHAVQWKSDHTDAQATITPGAITTETKTVSVKRTAQVETVDNMTLLNQTYYSQKSANVRSAPSTSGARVGSLLPGSSFTALGRTDNNWIAVGRKGVTVGYVYAPLVSSKAPAKQQAAQAANPTVLAATDLDSMPDTVAKQQGFDLDSVQVETVSAQTACKTLDYKVTTKGATEQQQVKACQADDGAWELI
ncbi:MAG: SH3 domain-containing protein [Gammaproteobacteria bacterium]|nr:SH3 domain-containing protein [Gammaproteobacteria bacterium]